MRYKLTLELGVSKPFRRVQELSDCSAAMPVPKPQMGVVICQGPDLAHFNPDFTEGKTTPIHDQRKSLWCSATIPLLSSRVSERKIWV